MLTLEPKGQIVFGMTFLRYFLQLILKELYFQKVLQQTFIIQLHAEGYLKISILALKQLKHQLNHQSSHFNAIKYHLKVWLRLDNNPFITF